MLSHLRGETRDSPLNNPHRVKKALEIANSQLQVQWVYMTQKPISEKAITDILQQHPGGMLAFIQQKVLHLSKLNQLWQASITSDIAAHSRVANYRDNCLVIEVDSAAWATRLRYILPEITEKLRKYPDLQELNHIEWYIQPQVHPSTTLKNQLVLSTTAARLLQTTADNIKVKSLQEALLRIANNTR